MPERFKYAHLFERNPFEGRSPEQMYAELQWNRKHERVFPIEAPEALVMLGTMARCYLESGHEMMFPRHAAFLAVGHRTNNLYVIPCMDGRPLANVPNFRRSMRCVGHVLRTDYYSAKGEKGTRENYYYHEHEQPYPSFYIDASGAGYIRPASHDGKRSYAVGPEGIVG